VYPETIICPLIYTNYHELVYKVEKVYKRGNHLPAPCPEGRLQAVATLISHITASFAPKKKPELIMAPAVYALVDDYFISIILRVSL